MNANETTAAKAAKPSKERILYWEFLEWGDCSKRCGSGIKISKPSCVEQGVGKISASMCQHLVTPEEKVMKCNEKPCKHK